MPIWVWAILNEAQLNLFYMPLVIGPLDGLGLEGVRWLDVGLVEVTSGRFVCSVFTLERCCMRGGT